MINRFNLLSQQLLEKEFSGCSVEELQQLSQQYPFFAPAQFLLLKKLQVENSPEYAQQLQKAALYHNNPLTLDLLINGEEYDRSLPPDATATDVETQISIPAPQPFQSLTFEPFHTVDYFASVGIKLSQEEIGKDSFGRQVKSFTEWLKTMKRLPAAEQLKKLDPHAEEKVENIAAHSLDNSEILTEAMAEVWVKQGKLEKAIEVYNKLSLLNPSKRAYFAAKLENLKKAI